MTGRAAILSDGNGITHGPVLSLSLPASLGTVADRQRVRRMFVNAALFSSVVVDRTSVFLLRLHTCEPVRRMPE